LNPIAHIDPIGTIIFPLLLAIIGAPVFGWAKPVVVNPYNLRNPRKPISSSPQPDPAQTLSRPFYRRFFF